MPAQVIRQSQQLRRFAVRGVFGDRLLQILDRFGYVIFLVERRSQLQGEPLGRGITGFQSLQLRDSFGEFSFLFKLSRRGKLRENIR